IAWTFHSPKGPPRLEIRLFARSRKFRAARNVNLSNTVSFAEVLRLNESCHLYDITPAISRAGGGLQHSLRQRCFAPEAAPPAAACVWGRASAPATHAPAPAIPPAHTFPWAGKRPPAFR